MGLYAQIQLKKINLCRVTLQYILPWINKQASNIKMNITSFEFNTTAAQTVSI